MAYSIRSFNKSLLISLYRGFRLNPKLISLSSVNYCNQRDVKGLQLEDAAELLKPWNSWTKSEIENSKNKLLGKRIALNEPRKFVDINEQIITSVILKCCEKFGFIENGILYFKCLVESGKKISVGDRRALLDLVRGKKDLSDENREFLYEQYMHLIEKSDVLDQMTLKSCVQFLCLHDAYLNEAINIIETKGAACDNVTGCWDCVASAAFTFSQTNLGWEVLNRITRENGLDLRIGDVQQTVTAYIDYCKGKVKDGTFSLEEFEKLLHFLADHHVSLETKTADVILSLKNLFDTLNESYERDYTWKLSCITVDRGSGHCPSCQNNLDHVELDEKSFHEIRTTFLSEFVIGNDVFIKSTPEEVKKYYKFLRATPHFDVIIDGLNVSHASVHEERIQLLLSVISNFESKDKSVLLLGRKHMKKWRGFEKITDLCPVFLFENASDDDAFLLYGALYKGWNTYICTGDYMRGKTNYFTDPRMVKLFQTWLRTHQYGFFKKTQELVPPIKHSIYTHKINNPGTLKEGEISWHIPYHTEFSSGYKFDLPFKWFCVQRRTRQTKGFQNITNIHELPLGISDYSENKRQPILTKYYKKLGTVLTDR